jgi:hypothetical protein
MSDLNKWNFISLDVTKNSTPEEQEDELNAVFAEVLHQYEVEAADNIIPGGFGAMDTTDPAAREGFYLIKWTSAPYVLQQPAVVEGCEVEMPEGTQVCDGRYLDQLDRSPHWYHYSSSAGVKKFRLQFIVEPNIEIEAYNPEAGIQPPANGLNFLAPRALASARRTIIACTQGHATSDCRGEAVAEKLDHFEINIEDIEEEEDAEEVDEEVEEDEDEGIDQANVL